jgi:hypothetical protein
MDESTQDGYKPFESPPEETRKLVVEALAVACVEVGLRKPSDALLAPLAGAVVGLWTEKSDANATTQ